MWCEHLLFLDPCSKLLIVSRTFYMRAHGKCTVSLIYDTSLNWVSLIPLLEKFQHQKMWKFSLKSRHFVSRCLWKMLNIGNSWHNFGFLWFILSNTTTIFWKKCHQEIDWNMQKNVSNSCLWYWINFVEYKEKYLRLTLRSHVALPFVVPGDNILD